MSSLEHNLAPAALPESDALRLRRLAVLAAELDCSGVAADAAGLAERVAEDRFFVACVGQFKRGKSTLLDALVGEAVLPTGVVPVTSLPTVVRYGARRSARVREENGAWKEIELADLAQYVSEELNPGNAKRVVAAEVFLPSALLQSGMCLVDTPGLGSVFLENTQTTHEFIPQIDAALVVIGADPPLSGDELLLVESVALQVKDVIFVLNKADKAAERDRNAAAAFSRRLLEQRLGRPIGQILEVSALGSLQNGDGGRDWARLLEILAHLEDGSERRLVRAAAERGVRRLSTQLNAALSQEREALVQPLQATEARMEELGAMIDQAEQSLGELSLRLTAEQNRMSRTFAERRSAFINKILPVAQDELRAALVETTGRVGPAFRRAAMEKAQSIVAQNLTPWLRSEEASAEEAFRQIERRFGEMADGFLQQAASAGLSGLALADSTIRQGLRDRSRFYFHEMLRLARPASPFRYVADLLLGILGMLGPIKTQAHEFLQQLFEVNSARVESDLNSRVQASRSTLEAEIRKLLRELRTTAERALLRGREAQHAGQAAVHAALARLDRIQKELDVLKS